MNLGLSWEIDIWGRVRNATDAARADLFASEEFRRAWARHDVKPLRDEHAKLQYEGTFPDGENKDAVMLMSLLLGWFGSDRTDDAEPEE